MVLYLCLEKDNSMHAPFSPSMKVSLLMFPSYLYLANGYTTAMYLSADIAKVVYIDPIYGQ